MSDKNYMDSPSQTQPNGTLNSVAHSRPCNSGFLARSGEHGENYELIWPPASPDTEAHREHSFADLDVAIHFSYDISCRFSQNARSRAAGQPAFQFAQGKDCASDTAANDQSDAEQGLEEVDEDMPELVEVEVSSDEEGI